MRTRPERPYWPYFRDDPEFENALVAEPDLYTFLREHASYLPARMQFTKERIQKWEEELDFAVLKCPACGTASVIVEGEFFEGL